MHQRQAKVRADRPEVHTSAGDHIHPGQQVGKGVVAAGPRGRDGLILGDAGGQLSADHAIEQQIGGMAEDPRDDDADRRSGDARGHHRDGRPPLRRQRFTSRNGRPPEVPRPHGAGGGGARAASCSSSRSPRHLPRRTSSDCDSANSR